VTELFTLTTVSPGEKGLCVSVSTDVLLLFLLKGSVLEVAKGSVEDCLRNHQKEMDLNLLKDHHQMDQILQKDHH
jgi:hypothetical protein